jgi:hypothetical protein
MAKKGGLRQWLVSIRDWLTDVNEQLAQHWRPWIRWPATILRWLLIVGQPVVLGAILGGVVPELFKNPIDPVVWALLRQRALFLFIITVGIAVGAIWQRAHNYTSRHADRLYHALKWFYISLELGKDESADIRCTIWAPVGRHNDDHAIQLEQVVDYMPRLGGVAPRKLSQNGQAGRRFRVARRDNKDILPVGILGRCAVDSVRKQVPQIQVEYLLSNDLNDPAAFMKLMVSKWNFHERQARRLTVDRRAYMCLSMMDASRSHLLGILYIDSCKADALPTQLGEKAQSYLPGFAELLTN